MEKGEALGGGGRTGTGEEVGFDGGLTGRGGSRAYWTSSGSRAYVDKLWVQTITANDGISSA